MPNYTQLLIDILLKKAKGFTVQEKTDEFAVTDGELTLVKSKVSTKEVLPDVSAVKALLDIPSDSVDVSDMTDEQLQVEKLRLLRLLQLADQPTDQPSEPPTDNSAEQSNVQIVDRSTGYSDTPSEPAANKPTF